MTAVAYRVLVVEDEDIVRNSIIRMLEAYQPRLELFEASDGQHGLLCATEHQPDIVLTDIKMPGMDGLSMIARIKAILPGLKCLILSGYDDFDFARQAIELRVDSYLLKPFDDSELYEKIDVLIQELKQESGRSYLPLLEIAPEPTGQEKLIRQMLLEAGPLPQSAAENPLRKRFYRCAALRIQGLKPIDRSPWLNISSSFLRRTLPDAQTLLIDMQENTFALLLGTDVGMASERVGDYLQQYQSHMRQRFHLDMLTGVNRRPVPPDRLAESWKEAEKAMEQSFFSGDPIVFSHLAVRPDTRYAVAYHRVSLRLTQLYEQVNSALLRSDLPRLEQDLRQVCNLLEENQEMGIRQAILECERMIALFYLAAAERNAADYRQVEQELRQDIRLAGSLEQVFKRITGRFLAAAEEQPPRRSGDSGAVAEAIRLIEGEYGNGITLSEIAGIISMSPNYLGMIFQRTTGRSFNAYITEHRVEHAKRLLLETDLPMRQITDRIGFSDVSYFSTIFKKQTGLTPGNYRKLKSRH